MAMSSRRFRKMDLGWTSPSSLVFASDTIPRVTTVVS
eukprot:COSAG01_NODE_42060_length_444_cov_0.602899_1_plen_36_part_10